MKLAASLSRISPKRLFRSKSKASVSRSEDPSSFSSNASSSSSDGSYGNLIKPAGPTATPISVLPPQSSGDFYTELVQAFKLIDRDDDGVVSRGDLAALLSRLSPEPPSQEEVSLMLKEVDGDNDDGGCISLEDLASRVAGTSGQGSVETEELREVFEYFDADRNGKISAEELHRVFGVIGDERCTLDECVRMIATVDRNGDGFVCFEDFCRMMELQSSSSDEMI
ncbi:PREDICTED: probable calcium-binding protein CML35 [Camelina sativa]|uniref:Probable calcium-binding protein CML35 n=1 Tax=Camelina sativa TaxID=90675 RepID=A0ABM0Z0I3_CAMSA|nr:PREDICTED: probable calcium-binding protein CML35 [Camelina sativa]